MDKEARPKLIDNLSPTLSTTPLNPIQKQTKNKNNYAYMYVCNQDKNNPQTNKNLTNPKPTANRYRVT